MFILCFILCILFRDYTFGGRWFQGPFHNIWTTNQSNRSKDKQPFVIGYPTWAHMSLINSRFVSFTWFSRVLSTCSCVRQTDFLRGQAQQIPFLNLANFEESGRTFAFCVKNDFPSETNFKLWALRFGFSKKSSSRILGSQISQGQYL